ncbi:TonB-dependent receptor [Sphingosinicella microcystinivorans]|uniref:TonB-dependent receptor n=1 Tax=Sphingosinicella microcystinivorans TaxID=335406 RepID=UPI0022F39341|nr:TonB-dependent receptor [Sphingosinicella microcystinivorans]WBX86141.1 TonB-dependent receptor [Sphingosinicella microcystinivorans]
MSSKPVRGSRCCSVVVSVLITTSVLACNAAYAQSAAPFPDSAAKPADDSSRDIPEIIVTAQRREQALSDVALSIQAFSGEALSNAGISNAADLVKLTPGINIAGAYGGNVVSYSIRGVVQQDFSAQAEGPIALYVDNGYLALNNVAVVGLFDLDRVEVLRGPQGTLFGRNATGGLVHVVTRKPSQTPNGYVALEYGSHNTVRVEAAAGAPLAPTAAFRVAGMVKRNDAYIKNLAPEGDDLGNLEYYGLRAHLLVEPSDTFNMLISGYRSESRTSTSPYYSASTRVVTNADGAQVNSVRVAGPTLLGTVPTKGGGLVVNQDEGFDNLGRSAFSGATLQLEWDIGPELTAISDYHDVNVRYDVDIDGTEFPFANSVASSAVRNYSQELRLSDSGERVRWTAGLFYLHIDAKIDPNRTPFPAVGPILIDDRAFLDTDSYSAFGQIEFDLSDQWTLVGGFRYTREEKDYFYSAEIFASDDGIPGPFIGKARPDYTGARKNDLVTARAQVEFRPSDGMLWYLGWNRGTKAGSFNAPYAGSTIIPDSEIAYKPETLDAFETGLRTELLGGRAQINGALFYYDYKNYQAFRVTGFNTQVFNRDARTYGFELGGNVRLSEALHVSAGISYLDNTVYDVDVSGVIADRRAPSTSKWSGNASVTHHTSLLDGDLAVQGDLRYSGASFYSISNFDSTRIGSFVVVDFNVSWTDGSGDWTLSAIAENILDRKYKTVGFDFSTLCGCSVEAYGRPQWFGASVKRRF